MNRPLATLAACMVSLAVLTGCGSDSETSADAGASTSTEQQAPKGGSSEPPAGGEAPGTGTKYCDLLGSDLASVFGGVQDPEGVDKVVRLVGDISEAAPKDIGKDWQTMQGALEDSKPQLVAGAKLQQEVQSGKKTQQEAAKEMQKIMKSMKRLDTPKFQQAGAAVSKHAVEYCGVGAPQ